jgi:hypothetical protein
MEWRAAGAHDSAHPAAPARPWRDTPLRASGLLGPVRIMADPAGW